jgi:hypothetical protein
MKVVAADSLSLGSCCLMEVVVLDDISPKCLLWGDWSDDGDAVRRANGGWNNSSPSQRAACDFWLVDGGLVFFEQFCECEDG